MQLRSTTPRALTILQWLAMIMLPTAVIVLAFVQTTSAESNDDRQARIDELTAQIDKKVSSTRSLNKQSDSISSQLSALKKERSYLESQMAQNQNDMASLKKTISRMETDVKNRQSALGTIMANMYVNGTITPVEMLASSHSVADYLDAQTQREAISDQLSASINDVKMARKRLSVQQDKLARIVGDQQNQKIALQQKESEQQTTLVATEGESAQLIKVTKKMAAQRKKLQTEQQQSIASMMSGATQVTSGSISEPVYEAPAVQSPAPQKAPAPSKSPSKSSGSKPSTSAPKPSKPVSKPKPKPVVLPNGGYPSYLNNCYVDSNALSYGIDPWGYGCRQCVSYTAWKVLQKTGRAAKYWGNAKQWPASARRVGYSTGSSPRKKSVAVMTSGPYGHVAWVESINSNGTLNVSQYNYWLPNKSNGGWGWYSEFRGVSPRTYQVYIYV